MIWNRRRQPSPSADAVQFLQDSHKDLKEARELREEARQVGANLAHSQQLNHFGLGLERAIKGTI